MCLRPTGSQWRSRRASSPATPVSGHCSSIRRSRRTTEPVGELALSSELFRTLWARHDVRGLDGGTITVNHPVVGELHLHRDKLPVDDVLLVLYYADHGSESDEKLRLLASMARIAPTATDAGSRTAEPDSRLESRVDPGT